MKVDTPTTYKLFVEVIPEINEFLEIYKSLHFLLSFPKSYKFDSLGTKLDINSPLTLISSVFSSPRFIVPPLKVACPINVETPATWRPWPTNKSPPVVVIPPLEPNVEIPLTFNVEFENARLDLLSHYLLPKKQVIFNSLKDIKTLVIWFSG